jgi:hypothetical protein
MSVIQFIQYSPDQLQKEINEGIKIQLDEFLKHYKPKPPNEYLTRHELAQMFNVDISTIHNWCKRGILQPRGIGGRVYFLRSQVESSIKPLNV